MDRVPTLGRAIFKATLDIQQMCLKASLKETDEQKQIAGDLELRGNGISKDLSGSTTSHASMRVAYSARSPAQMLNPSGVSSWTPWDTTQAETKATQLRGRQNAGVEVGIHIRSSQQLLSPLADVSLEPPWTYSYQEITFGRRLHRACIERCFYLLASGNAPPDVIHRKLGWSLLFSSPEQLMNNAQLLLSKSIAGSLSLEDGHPVPFTNDETMDQFYQSTMPGVVPSGGK